MTQGVVLAAGVVAQGGPDASTPLVGNGLTLTEGANQTVGVATLVAGTATVNTTKVAANSRIFLTEQVLAGVATPSALAVSARVAGVSFTILASSAGDTSSVAWMIVNPAP